MNFSYNYEESMTRLISPSRLSNVYNSDSAFRNPVLMLNIEKTEGEFWEAELPTFGLNTYRDKFLNDGADKTRVVIPLLIDGYRKSYSGAETMLRYFARGYSSSRLLHAFNPKSNHDYYGSQGIVLDSDLTPLLLSTIRVKVVLDRSRNGIERKIFEYDKPTVYLHPKVFTDDEGFLNKSLAKKGVAFFLSSYKYWYNGNECCSAKVVIEDPSRFLVKPQRPTPQDTTKETLYDSLKSNIGDVLSQIIDD